MDINSVPEFIRENYEIREWRHAVAILRSDFVSEWNDVLSVLSHFRLHRSEILKPGGRKSAVAARIDAALTARDWRERCFATKIVIDETEIESPTHKVDCFKNGIGLEIEWNNKDPFYDRDLNNFRLLFELRALHVGIIVTRCDELQRIFDVVGRGDSYGHPVRCRRDPHPPARLLGARGPGQPDPGHPAAA